MPLTIIRQFGIEPANNTWTFEVQGDPSVLGLAAGIGSRAIQMDSSPPGDIWDKTGVADTAWTLELSLPSTTSPLSADQIAALGGTSGTPSGTNRYVTDSDTRLIGGGSTGGLPGQFVSTAQSMTGDGSTDDGPALQTLANTTIAGSGTIYYTPGKTYRIATATTVPVGVSNWFTQGASLTVDGVALTVNGPIVAGLYQIFNCINGGVVQFSTTNDAGATKRVVAVPEIYPEWWGAKADGSNDDTVALNACIAAATGLPSSGVSTARFAGPPVRLSAGVYKVTDALQVTDTIGIRITGAGFWNTYISFTAGETGTATSGSTTTLVNSGKSWTTNQWGTGRWQAYIYAGTGSGQWCDIASNTATTLTFSAAVSVAPDNTSQYVIALKAVLDLDGFFSGTLADFQIMGSGYFRHGVKYYRRSSLSARGSSQGRFDRVSIGGNYVDSGWQFGGNDLSAEHGFQADLVGISKCQAIGQGATSGIFAAQRGFIFGDSTFANALNFTADACESVSNAYGVTISATNLLWTGGTIQSSSQADILLNQGLQGYSEINGFRSESSAMLLDSTSSQQTSWSFRLANVQFQMDQMQGNRLISWRFGSGSLILDNIRTVASVITGTASSATSTTLVDSTKSFSTATKTYVDGQTAVGLAGWDLQIVAGTGNGQRRKITSNTATTLTVPAWTVTPDATSQYQIMPRGGVVVENIGATHISMNGVQLSATPLEQFVTTGPLGGAWDAELRGCAELDVNANTTLGSTAPNAGALYFTSSLRPASLGFGAAATIPDTRIHRAAAGVIGIPGLRTSSSHVQAVGTTPTGQATSSGGSTTYNYKLVAISGGQKALASATFSVTNAPATLSPSAFVRIALTPSSATSETPADAYDVLKDDGTGTFKSLALTVPWYLFQGNFIDTGGPLSAYTLPVADGTGNLTVDGNATVGGTINSATVSTSTVPTAAQLTGLTGGGDTSLHFHSADRARSNHTGTQSLSTIAGGTATGSGYTLPDLTVSGLITANGGISGTLSQTTITANYTVLTTDQVILADATAGNIVVTLPAASAEGAREVAVKKIDSSANTVRVAAAGTDTIDGAASVTLSLQYAWIDITGDGTSKWNILSASTTAVSVAASSVTPGSFASGGYTFPSTLTVSGTATFSNTGSLNANGNAFFGQAITQKLFNAGNSGTALTLNSSNANWQKITLTGNVTLTITAPGNPWPLTLYLIQDATGSRTVTWPASVKWAGGTAPTLTTTASKTDIICLRWDGSATFYGEVVGLNY